MTLAMRDELLQTGGQTLLLVVHKVEAA